MDAHKTFGTLARDDQDYRKLIDEIIDMAEGVFLRVHLACRSLLDGVSHGDRIHTLRKRLHRLPQQLREISKQILATIPAEY